MLRISVVTIPLLFLCCSLALAANFTCSDSEITACAEHARVESARFWTGRPLPGDWNQPCPIRIQWTNHGGSGSTTFSFSKGEVFGWSMAVQGDRKSLLRDVIPHEVDHAVRASLARRSLPRWLDEGCATLWESAEAHAHLRQLAWDHHQKVWPSGFLERMDYPLESRDTLPLYAFGFTLTEYLLEQRGPRAVLAVQTDQRSLARSLPEHFGLSVDELQTRYNEWLGARRVIGTECSQLGCPFHTAAEPPSLCECLRPPENVLTVWTATWCGPCLRFWHDYQTDRDFQLRLTSRFHVHARDFDRAQQAAADQSIRGVPTFQLPDGNTVVGYIDKATLLHALGIDGRPAPSAIQEAPLPPLEIEPPVRSPAPQPPSSAISPPVNAISPTKPPLLTGDAASSKPPAPSVRENDRGRPQPPAEARDPPQSSRSAIASALPGMLLTALQLTGVIGGSALTGGAGALLIPLALRLLKRGVSHRTASATSALPEVFEGSGSVIPDASRLPFPRRLDEAYQLLELRKSEGRVAVLDALRGMFLDDEVEKSAESDPATATAVRQLKSAIDARIAEVAPLATKIGA